MPYRSSELLDNVMFTENRALYKSMGYSDEDLKGPLIGIANSWNELVPGHINLRRVAEFVKKGIHRTGGMALEFGVIGACDGQACGHIGMKYILPSRDLIANDIETMVQAHRLDGIVMLGSCDKIIPGMLMAAVRLNIPSIIAVGGPMIGGIPFDGRQSDSTSVSEAVGMLNAGKIDMETLRVLEDTAAPACGSCSYFGTANSMGCVSEALGMSLPGTALIPASYSARFRTSEFAGRAIINLVKRNIKPREIVNLKSLENAVSTLISAGGSTNCFMHLSAIAYEIGIDAETMLEMYDSVSEKIPSLAKVNPSSQYNMEDFYKAGGIPQVMKMLEQNIHRECITVSGKTVGENLDAFSNPYGSGNNVIRTLDDPFTKSKGLAVLRGNLAPGTAITKPIAMDPTMYYFAGPARVFDGEEEANKAIMAGDIKPGDVLVIRYEGPRGGPGMREMYFAMKLIYGLGLSKKVALITDGRFSGTNNGCFAGHISPEAEEGGPIAVVQDGDKIIIDIANKTLSMDIPQEVIDERLRNWKKPEPKEKSGYLAVYSKLAASAAEGAMMKI